jgi:hypothetical protein
MMFVMCSTMSVLPSLYAGPPATLFPLEVGNRWVYETENGQYSLLIGVTSQVHAKGYTYYVVSGYGLGSGFERLLVRQAENGALYAFDDEGDRDVLLTSFEHVPGGWFQSRVGHCDDEGSVDAEPEPWNFGSDNVAAATAIRYRNVDCGEMGLQKELYVENLGLVRRVLNTEIGTLDLRLVYAQVGKFTYQARSFANLSLDLNTSKVDRVPGATEDPVRIRLRYVVQPRDADKLRFRSAQRFDVFLIDSNGNEVWRWSDTDAFIQPIEEAFFNGYVEYHAFLPTNQFPVGKYTIQGWLNLDSERQPVVSMPFEIRDGTSGETAARSRSLDVAPRTRPHRPQAE